ncbi:MAG: DegQ family serine endoprotease [Halofilum sp. (in: g-proteobacteria)]|nr:DegQ family serine endoprotease [Halofilum sp. (in: g-proteobacteria)]
MRNSARVLAVALIAVLSAMAALQPARASVPDFSRIVSEQRAAVVNISTTQKIDSTSSGIPPELLERLPPDSPFRDFFRRFGGDGQPQQRERSSLGSGFIVSEDGFILTNAHVVAEADEIVVRLEDNREFEAEVIGTDKDSDVGVLKIDAENLPTVELGDSDELKVGQWVLAIGSPFGLDHTATQGIVSALNRSLPNDTYTPFIQTDVAVNPGNSGGPLFNGDGEVVGINSQIFSRTGGYMGLSFAVPINTAMDIAKQLRETGRVERGYLGVTIQPVDRGLAESFGLDKPVGALVSDLIGDGPAARAGLQPGDVILEFNGTKIIEAADLPPAVGTTPVGSEAEVTIMREGERMTLDVEVGRLSDYRESDSDSEKASRESDTSLNVAVRELSADERSEMELGDRGLLVQKVGPGPVADAGIRPGDILLRIGKQPLIEVEDMRKAIENLPAGKPVAIQIRRGDRTLFVSLTLPEAQ